MLSRTERQGWYLAALLTLLALIVRVPGLDSGLWADEIYSTLYAFRTPFPQQLTEFHGDNKHPFYSVLAHITSSWFGESPWTLRLPALLFGAATIPALLALGNEITSRIEARSAALLLAVSYHHAWFSQNARGYSLLGFCAVISTWLLLRILRTGNRRSAFFYVLVISLGAYTHLTFAFAVVAQFIVAMLAVVRGQPDSRRYARLAVLSVIGGGALALVFYAPIATQVVDFFLHKESALKGVSSPSWAAGEALRVLTLGGVEGRPIQAALALVAILVAGTAGLIGAISYLRQDQVVAALLMLPAFTMLGGALLSRGTMYPRFFFLLAGFAVLIGVRGVVLVARWVAARFGASGDRLAGGILITAAVASAATLPLTWTRPKQDYDGALRFVEEEVRKSAAAVATADMTSEIYTRYFGRSWHDVRDVSALDRLRSQGTVLFVYTFPRYLARFDAGLADVVRRDCGTARAFRGSVSGGDVMVCTLGAIGT